MQEIDKTSEQPSPSKSANKYSFKATIALYKAMPIGLRRIIKATVAGFGILVVITILHPNLQKWAFLAGATLNLLIAFVVAIQAYIYVGQSDVMDRQLRLTREQFAVLQRPFLFLKTINVLAREDSERPNKFWFTAHPILENSGNTPTKNLQVGIQYALRETRLPKGFDFPIQQISPSLIGPKGIITGAVGTIKDDDLLAVQQGTKHFYMWGKATYFDYFRDTPIHTTRFCLYVTNVIGNPLRPFEPTNPAQLLVDFSFWFHDEHNDAD